MHGHQPAGVEDLDLIGELMHLDHAAGAIGHAVEIAADADHALMGDAPFQSQHGPEREGRERLQDQPLFGEGLGDEALGRAVHAPVGHRVEPAGKLRVEVVEIADRAGEEEVLADIAEGAPFMALAASNLSTFLAQF